MAEGSSGSKIRNSRLPSLDELLRRSKEMLESDAKGTIKHPPPKKQRKLSHFEFSTDPVTGFRSNKGTYKYKGRRPTEKQIERDGDILEDDLRTVSIKGYKTCPYCGIKLAIAKRKCSNEVCLATLPKKAKDMEKIKTMGRTIITQQRHLMEKRADILHQQHGCDVVILIHHKHGRGDTLTVYGTEGAGLAFIGHKGHVPASEHGAMTQMMFTKFVQDMVIYAENGSFMAAGFLQPDRQMLHGHKIPEDHVCVLLTTAGNGHPAPLILGDAEENTLLVKGKFFAMPKRSLLKASMINDNTVSLKNMLSI